MSDHADTIRRYLYPGYISPPSGWKEAHDALDALLAEIQRLRDALAAYRSALRSGEPESERLRAVGGRRARRCPRGGRAVTCNALRLPDMAPLRAITETIRCDDVIRVERLSCGHTKTTLTASVRPAFRRRCLKCAAAVRVEDE